jgi:hypothetical protein
VEKNKFFLVNLNADPSLNELLVYYLKERTLVGRPEAPNQPDIQLMGLGIQVTASWSIKWYWTHHVVLSLYCVMR